MKIFTQHRLGLLFVCLLGSVLLSGQEKATSKAQDQQVLKDTKEYRFMHGKVRADRPLIGIYTDHAAEGIGISSTVQGGGAAAAGLEAGDVITAINGKQLRNVRELQEELSKYEGGQTVTVAYLHQGQSRQAQVTLKAKPVIKADRPLIGIYPNHSEGEGIRVDDITAGGGAVQAGIRSGDIITQINDAPINSLTDLKAELSKYEGGQAVSVRYVRKDQMRKTQVTLQERNNRNNWTQKRNPCDVFIGVSMGGSRDSERGVRIGHIIDDTPAQAADVRDGDVILALDDVFVNTFNELLHERNKHQPGDYFTLTVVRDGSQMDIEAQFKNCEEEEVPVEKEVEQEEEIIKEETPDLEPVIRDNTLKVTQWRAFPNPAFGNLTVQFEAEAVPTNIRLLDVNGRAVFQENQNNFDGYYNRQIELRGVTPGNYFLQVRQGERVITEKIVVMPRA